MNDEMHKMHKPVYRTGEAIELFDQVRLDVAGQSPQGTVTATRPVADQVRVGYRHPVSGLWLSTWFPVADLSFDGRHRDVS